MRDPMLDEEFLHQLDQYPHKFLWAKIISLNMDEYPVEEISGKITSGSVNIDGTSAVRRTCSISMVAENVNIIDYYWTLKTKFKFEIGVENWINSEYPDIIWFNQGIFVLTSFNCTAGVNNYTINIQGKDKMTLLNGDLGGVIPASWDFATEDVTATNENGETIYDSSGRALINRNHFPIKSIITEAVHEFTQDAWQNIIVNDLDDYGIELLEYIGDTPLYYILKAPDSSTTSRECWNMTLNGSMPCKIINDGVEFETTLSQIENTNYTYEKLIEMLDPGVSVTSGYNIAEVVLGEKDNDGNITYGNNRYTIAKVTRDNGLQVCGYRITDIIYPYDLIAAPGDTVTSVLDKLVKMLGNFEYFYDVDGRFIFQKKRTYLDVSYNNIINEHNINPEVWATSSMYSSKYSYTFDNHTLVSSIQNSPNLSNIKNDFSLWGQRQNGNVTVPIHMRYAIDSKPMYYKAIGGHKYADEGQVFYTEEFYAEEEDEQGNIIKKGYLTSLKNNPDYKDTIKEDILTDNAKKVDWREIIFQMANDYRRWYHDSKKNFLTEVRENNKYTSRDSFYEHGITGYEQYYIDFEMNLSQGVIAYWRELYNPNMINKENKSTKGNYDSDGNFISYDSVKEWQPYEVIKNQEGQDEYVYEYEVDENGVEILDEEGHKIPVYEVDWQGNPLKDKDDKFIQKKKRTVYNKGDLVAKKENNDEIIVYKSLRDNNTKDLSVNKYWIKVNSLFTYDKNGWNVNIINNPEVLNFWFDFIDTQGELGKYSVHNIGLRSKAANDDKIKAIYFREVPNVIFEVNSEKTQPDKWIKPGYCYVNIPSGFNSLFKISSRGKNAMDVIEEYLYSYTYPASSITLTTVPIYYLTPNTLIYVNDTKTGSVGEYIAQRYSIQFGLGTQMSINAVETAKRIY